MHYLRYAGMLALSLSAWQAAAEVGGPPLTKAELLLLPPYCEARLLRTEGQYDYWRKIFGQDFDHTHHYCYGLAGVNRYYRARSRQEKTGHLDSAYKDYSYVIRAVQPTYGPLPEVYLNRGVLLTLMKKDAEALADMMKALELDPKLARAYIAASDLYAKINQKDQALKVVGEGLRHLPGNAGLQRVYTKLGGKLPYPEPYVPQADAAATSTMADADPSKAAAEEEPSGQPSSIPAEKEVKSKTATKAQSDATTRNLAVFDFSRNVGAAQDKPAIKGAGAYIVVEVSEDPSSPNNVLFKIRSYIPQPASRIMIIAIDTGYFSDLIASVTVPDKGNGKYFKMTSPRSHAYWPGFSPEFMFEFDGGRDARLYDPRALPPGGSLTLAATLGPGKSFADVIQAMNVGTQYNTGANGLRLGVIGYHLLGVRPDPTKTIMDDAGFVTGSLRQISGPIANRFSNEATDQADKVEASPGSAKDETAPRFGPTDRDASLSAETGGGTPPSASTSETSSTPPVGTPANPRCRFCPESN